MGIPIKEAKRKLDILENINKNPELILTDLFSHDINGSNFLLQVEIDEQYIMDYIKGLLSTIPVFKNCKIKYNGMSEFSFYVPSLRYGEYAKFENDDLIVKIDLNDKTYITYEDGIQKYEYLMTKKYELEYLELHDWYKKISDFSLKNRFSQIHRNICSKKKSLSVKIENIWFWFSLPLKKKKINQKVKQEMESIESSNRYREERHEYNLKRQKFLKINAPTKIKQILNKQEEISNYLDNLGYLGKTYRNALDVIYE